MPALDLLLYFSIIAAVLNLIDASIGMGYGTSLTIIFFLYGYDPGEIVLPILISGVIAGFLASIFHAIYKNIEIKRTEHIQRVNIQLNEGKTGITDDIKITLTSRRISDDARIVIIFTASGVASAITGALLLSLLSGDPIANLIVKVYIGLLVLVLGIAIIRSRSRSGGFSYKRLLFIGGIAGFNKSISGGGFGPVAIAGQMILGRDGRKSIGTTSLSEAIISIASIIVYFIAIYSLGLQVIDWYLVMAITIGASSTSPVASYIAAKVDKQKYKRYVAFALVGLSILTFVKVFIIDPIWA